MTHSSGMPKSGGLVLSGIREMFAVTLGAVVLSTPPHSTRPPTIRGTVGPTTEAVRPSSGVSGGYKSRMVGVLASRPTFDVRSAGTHPRRVVELRVVKHVTRVIRDGDSSHRVKIGRVSS